MTTKVSMMMMDLNDRHHCLGERARFCSVASSVYGTKAVLPGQRRREERKRGRKRRRRSEGFNERLALQLSNAALVLALASRVDQIFFRCRTCTGKFTVFSVGEQLRRPFTSTRTVKFSARLSPRYVIYRRRGDVRVCWRITKRAAVIQSSAEIKLVDDARELLRDDVA